MLSPLAPSAPRPRTAREAAPSLAEAFEMRLLGEVARWGDEAAFDELYVRHHDTVAAAARAICDDRHAVEDIVQHTFTALWIRAERIVEKSVRLRPWLQTVARNAAIDHVRARRTVEPIDEAGGADSVNPELLAIAGESGALLAAALDSLSDDQRIAITCIYLDEMTYASTAEALSEPLGTVKSRVRLGLGHLRAYLQAAG